LIAPSISGTGSINFISGTLSSSSISAKLSVGPLATLSASSDMTIGDASSYNPFTFGGALDINSHTVTLNAKAFSTLGNLTTLSGGTLVAPNGIALPTGGNLVGSGTVSGKVSVGFGSTIDASGNLALGDSNSPAGFYSDGELYTRKNTVTINDSNAAVLGSLTQLGTPSGDGALSVPNGALVAAGNNLTGRGTVISPNLLAKAFVNNGDIAGDAPSTPLVFNGYVKGSGTFTNTVFNGTFSPGNSPAAVSVDTVALGPNADLIMELGGLGPGSQYDQLVISDSATLGGTLDVGEINGFVPQLGNTFDLLAGSVSGTFSEVNLPVLGPGLTWDSSQLFFSGAISVVPEPTPLGLTLLPLLLRWLTRRRQGSGTDFNMQPARSSSYARLGAYRSRRL
jgi:hypothetical protein